MLQIAVSKKIEEGAPPCLNLAQLPPSPLITKHTLPMQDFGMNWRQPLTSAWDQWLLNRTIQWKTLKVYFLQLLDKYSPMASLSLIGTGLPEFQRIHRLTCSCHWPVCSAGKVSKLPGSFLQCKPDWSLL